GVSRGARWRRGIGSGELTAERERAGGIAVRLGFHAEDAVVGAHLEAVRAGEFRERAIRALRIEMRLALTGKARALVTRRRDHRKPLHGNRIGEHTVETERMRVEWIQQRGDVVE